MVLPGNGVSANLLPMRVVRFFPKRPDSIGPAMAPGSPFLQLILGHDKPKSIEQPPMVIQAVNFDLNHGVKAISPNFADMALLETKVQGFNFG